jgi:hypothetical protein
MPPAQKSNDGETEQIADLAQRDPFGRSRDRLRHIEIKLDEGVVLKTD